MMEIEQYVKIEGLGQRIKEINHSYGINEEIEKEYKVISFNGVNVAEIYVHTPIVFYKLLLEGLIDDMVSIAEEDYYKMACIKYVDEEYGKKVRLETIKKLEDFELKSALIISTKTLYYNLNKEKIQKESFIKDFNLKEDIYIKIFNSLQDRTDYILGIDIPFRIIFIPVEVLSNKYFNDQIIL